MIHPEPWIMEHESNREFEFQLGRLEQVPIEKMDTPEKSAGNATPVEAVNPDAAAPEEPQTEEKWVLYKINQTQEDMKQIVRTDCHGKTCISDLEFVIDDNFKSGLYEIVITDVTPGLDENERLYETRLDFKIFDSEADAEALAQAQAAGKGGKKK